MSKHRKRRSRHSQIGRHRVVTPKSNLSLNAKQRLQKAAIAFPLAFILALHPIVAGDGTGSLPTLGIITPFLGLDMEDEAANRREVTTEPTEPRTPPVDELPSP